MQVALMEKEKGWKCPSQQIRPVLLVQAPQEPQHIHRRTSAQEPLGY